MPGNSPLLRTATASAGAVTESAESDFEVRGMAVPYGWLSMFVMVGVNLRDPVRQQIC